VEKLLTILSCLPNLIYALHAGRGPGKLGKPQQAGTAHPLPRQRRFRFWFGEDAVGDLQASPPHGAGSHLPRRSGFHKKEPSSRSPGHRPFPRQAEEMGYG